MDPLCRSHRRLSTGRTIHKPLLADAARSAAARAVYFLLSTIQMTPKNVRTRRIALGMSVKELAEIFGIPAAVLREFETGSTPLPDAEKYRPLLDRLEQGRRSDRNR